MRQCLCLFISLLVILIITTLAFIWIIFYWPNQKNEVVKTIRTHKWQPMLEHRHHSNDELESIIDTYSNYYPDITRAYTIGRTKRNNRIIALEISDKPGEHEPGEAEIKLVGNIHGNEVVGRELLLQLIHHLLSTYEFNLTTKYLVDNVRIHIVPSLNPDGYEDAVEGECYGVTGRTNANGVDLNRNFPDQFHTTSENANLELETMSIMEWSKHHPFVLSASFHGGALVANYPFDNNPFNLKQETKSPDDDVFRYLALTYSMNHPDMKKDGKCKDACDFDIRESFPNGITNGAAWYPVSGGMQDWNYIHTNCFELTLEVGCQKYPMSDQLEKYWMKNKNSIIKLINATYIGVHGFVFDTDGNAIQDATISIAGLAKNVTTYTSGDYWRLLTPNQIYTIIASKPGYISQSLTIHIPGSYQVNFTLTSLNYPITF